MPLTDLPRDRSDIAPSNYRDRRRTDSSRGAARAAGVEAPAESGLDDLLRTADCAGPILVPALAAVAEILCYLFRIDGEGRGGPASKAEDPAR